jgi:hypothetical protein
MDAQDDQGYRDRNICPIMSSMIIIVSLLGAVALAGLAARFGAESRPGFDERPEPHTHQRWI